MISDGTTDKRFLTTENMIWAYAVHFITLVLTPPYENNIWHSLEMDKKAGSVLFYRKYCFYNPFSIHSCAGYAADDNSLL